MAHYFQNGDMYGETRGAICPEHMTNEVWDYIFLRGWVVLTHKAACALHKWSLDARCHCCLKVRLRRTPPSPHRPAPKECAISQATLDAMRAEFEFWYPFDLRVRGARWAA